MSGGSSGKRRPDWNLFDEAQGLVASRACVGAELAREGALETAKSFAGKLRSHNKHRSHAAVQINRNSTSGMPLMTASGGIT